jgi:flagellar biosynthesis protein FlhF
MLTLDTYRIGAVEQLATYARLLGIPLEVALSVDDVASLVASHADKDLILIDTIGRSQRSREQLAELARFLRAADPTEVHLAVSASSNAIAQTEAVGSFGVMSPGALVLTKLDECPQPGCVLGVASSSMLPFSYVTYGQDVPDDIAVARSESLAQLVWEGTP